MPINPYDLEVLGNQGLWDYGDLQRGSDSRGMPVQQSVTPNFGLEYAKKRWRDAPNEAGRNAARLMGAYYRSQGANLPDVDYDTLQTMKVPDQFGGHIGQNYTYLDRPTMQAMNYTPPPIQVNAAVRGPAPMSAPARFGGAAPGAFAGVVGAAAPMGASPAYTPMLPPAPPARSELAPVSVMELVQRLIEAARRG